MKKRPSYLEAGKRRFLKEGKRGLQRVAALPTPAPDVEPPPVAAQTPDFDLGRWRVRPGMARMTRSDRMVKLEATTLGVLLVLREGQAAGSTRGPLVPVELCAARVFGHVRYTDAVRLAVGELRRLLDGEDARIDSPEPGHYQLVIGEGAAEYVLDEEVPGADAVSTFLQSRRRRRALFGVVSLGITLGIGSLLVNRINDGQPVLRGTPGKPALLTRWPGQEESPSFAPDGRRLVFSWTPERGASDLFVVGFLGEPPVRLLPPAPPGAVRRFPAWSPNARLIAYYQLEGLDCQLRVTAPTGEGDRLLTACNAADVGPLAWTRDSGGLVFGEQSAFDEPVRLVAYYLDDKFGNGRRVQLTNPPIGSPGDGVPAFTADGRSLYFVRERALGNADVAAADYGIATVRRLTRDATQWTGLLVEPGDRSLLGSSDRGGASALWRVPATGGMADLLLEDAADLRRPALSPDGRRLVYERARELTRVLAVDDATGDAAPRPWPLAEGRHDTPAWSPDGSRVAFVSDATGHPEVWIASADGSDARALTDLQANRIDTPRWSPDGRSIVLSAAREGWYSVYVVASSGGKPVRLTTDEADERVPSWSSDGQWLYYASTRGAVAIDVIGSGRMYGARWQVWRRAAPGSRLEGKAPEQLTRQGGFAALEAPDGRSLLFTRPDRPGLWQRPIGAEGDDAMLNRELASSDHANWAVTRDAVYLVSREDAAAGTRGTGIARLVRMDWQSRESGTLRTLAKLSARGGLAVSAAGTRLLYPQAVRTDVDLVQAAMR
jgi:Tol biopolymer transport system component